MNKQYYILTGIIVLTTIIGVIYYLNTIAGQTTAASREDITVMMPFLPDSEWSAFYCAINKGYYADEGLNVTMLYTFEGGFGAIKQVVSGNVDFGYAGGDSVTVARSRDIPIVSIYQSGHNNLFGLIVKEASGIETPKDLEGKIIGIAGPGSPTEIGPKAILKNSGVDIDKVTFVPVGAQMIASFMSNSVDASGSFPAMEGILKKQGVPYKIWYPKDFNANFVTSTIVTSEKTIKENPKLVEKFVRATKKGFEYAIEHPEEAIEIYIKFNPDAEKNKDVYKFIIL